MNSDDHAIGLGKVVANLQALEAVLRLFLAGASDENADLPQEAGVTVGVNHLTNFDSLGVLVDKYIGALSESEASDFKIDRELVKLRDSLAHGRLLSPFPEPPVTLYRFGKPAEGRVPVESVETLTNEWFGKRLELVRESVLRVVACSRHRGYQTFPPD